MERKVAQYIQSNALLPDHSCVVVALSGGADSVALLRVLLSLGYSCAAAHCNFHLRGEESDRDERFVRRLCNGLGVTCYVTHFDTVEYAHRKHVSIEMAARELRYAWFEELRVQCGAQGIAVAHHQDDSVETLLLNLLRGTGIRGLQGIRPRNGFIIRPMLGVARKDIEDYLHGLGQDYVTDSTNLHDDYTRNKIRLNLLPLMEEINPSARANLAKTALHLTAATALYTQAVNAAIVRTTTPEGIRTDWLLKEAEASTILFEILYPLGFNAAQVSDVMSIIRQGQSGRQVLSATHRVVFDRHLLLIKALGEGLQPVDSLDGLSMKYYPYDSLFVIPREKKTACLDADKLQHPLTVRRWRHGDTFVPFGMKGRKRVSDYLTDRKFTLLQKEKQQVLCCGDDIVWLIGERSDDRYRITSATKRVLVVELLG